MITAVLLGAGGRGAHSYGPYALANPDQIRFVAVAEPDPMRRAFFAEAHNIPVERQFSSWEELAGQPRLADTCVNCTQDQTHLESTRAMLALGYDTLLEKPMAHRLADSVQLVQAAEQHGRLLQICHVLRYTPFFQTLHAILASGKLGQIVAVEHRENVAFWHMAHSFVRGNWRNLATSSPMILAKCCHDLDILVWNMGRPKRIHSVGSLLHYRPEQAPPGATARCTDGCPAAAECPWDARQIYLREETPFWLRRSLSADQSRASLYHALETGPYGRCVYHCDNDVVDNQVVQFDMESGANVTLVMHGHSHEEGRTMRYDGSRATLRGRFGMGDDSIELHDHLTGQVEHVPIPAAASGHGGGDFGIMQSFVQAVRGEQPPLTTARESLESHLIAFAAEESRLTGQMIDMQRFRVQAEHHDTPSAAAP